MPTLKSARQYGVLKQRFLDRLPWLVGAGIGIADLPAASALAQVGSAQREVSSAARLVATCRSAR